MTKFYFLLCLVTCVVLKGITSSNIIRVPCNNTGTIRLTRLQMPQLQICKDCYWKKVNSNNTGENLNCSEIHEIVDVLLHVGCYIYGATQNNQCDNDETLNSMIDRFNNEQNCRQMRRTVRTARCPIAHTTPTMTSTSSSLCTSTSNESSNMAPINNMLSDRTFPENITPSNKPSETSIPALAVLTVILGVSLVVVTTGWIITCFVFKKKMKQADKEQVKEGTKPAEQDPNRYINPAPPQASYYSSLGPDYEVVDDTPTREGDPTNNEEVDHDYHVLEVDNSNNSQPMAPGQDGVGYVAADYEVPLPLN